MIIACRATQPAPRGGTPNERASPDRLRVCHSLRGSPPRGTARVSSGPGPRGRRERGVLTSPAALAAGPVADQPNQLGAVAHGERVARDDGADRGPAGPDLSMVLLRRPGSPDRDRGPQPPGRWRHD